MRAIPWLFCILLPACAGDSPLPAPDPVPARLEIRALEKPLEVGATVKLQAIVYDQLGQSLSQAGMGWTSESPEIASVNHAGGVTGLTRGTARITATVADLAATIEIPVRASGLRLYTNPGSAVLVPGDTLSVISFALDADGEALIAQPGVTWKSGNAAIVSLREANNGRQAIVTAIGYGETTVTATVDGLEVSLEIRVLAEMPAGETSARIVDFRVIEYRYPGFNDYYYTPLIRVEDLGETEIYIQRLDVSIPGLSQLPAYCAFIRMRPLEPADLIGAHYGEYEITFGSGPGERVVRSEEATVVIKYVSGSGVHGRLAALSRVLPGSPPGYSGGDATTWRGC